MITFENPSYFVDGSYKDGLVISDWTRKRLRGYKLPGHQLMDMSEWSFWGSGVIKIDGNNLNKILLGFNKMRTIEFDKNRKTIVRGCVAYSEINAFNIALQDIIKSGHTDANIFFDFNDMITLENHYCVIKKRNKLLDRVKKLGIKINYFKVKSHSGLYYNEMVDRLAYSCLYKFVYSDLKFGEYKEFKNEDMWKNWIDLGNYNPPII